MYKRNPYLSSYTEEFEKTLESNPNFAKLWAEDSIKRELITALMGARIEAKLTQKELAQKAGLRQPNIARIESGQVTPSIKTLGRLAKAMGKKLSFSFA